MFVSRYFLIFLLISSLTHWLFKTMLFYFHKFVDIQVFLLILIFNFIPLWLGKILGMISVFLSFVKTRFVAWHVLFPRKCFMCNWENVDYAVVVWSVIYLSVRSIWFIMMFKSSVSQVIFYLVDISTIESEVLKCPTVIVLLSISPFDSVNVCPSDHSFFFVVS